MKKLVIFITLIMTIPVVFAKEEFKYYELVRIYGPYSENADSQYPLLDVDDYIYGEYKSSFNIPEEKPGREIKTREVYEYERVKNVNYISIINHSEDVTVTQVIIKYNGQSIDYTVSSDLNNFQNSSEIFFYLNEKLDPTLLELYIKANTALSDMTFTIGCDDVMFAKQLAGFAEEYRFKAKEATSVGNNWQTDYYDEYRQESRIMNFIGQRTLYEYRDKLYHTYKEEKQYYYEYSEEPNLEYRDENISSIHENFDNSLEIISVPNTGISYSILSNNILTTNVDVKLK